MSAAQFEQSDGHGPLFVGWSPRECGEHRTVGDYRAWCFDCTEWCYSAEVEMACKGCLVPYLRAHQDPGQALAALAVLLTLGAALAGVSVLLSWPLAVTAGIGVALGAVVAWVVRSHWG